MLHLGNKDDFFKIGKVKKKTGKNNNEFLIVKTTDIDIFALLDDTIFVDVNGCDLLPVFPIAYSEQNKNTVKVTVDEPFVDINLKKYLNKDAYIPISAIKDLEVDVSNYNLIGWTVYDTLTHFNGVVVDTISSVHQLTLIVRDLNSPDEEEVFIPLNEDLMESYNVQEKHIEFNLPEGLLTINKSNV